VNKVVSIEIAGQVFWIEEEAYDALRDYLKKIKIQLSEDECADEIFQDIELRIAELLFALNSDKQKAIVLTQLDEVLTQVGFIDDEEQGQEVELPRKSFRDPKNKILGGVCAGLAVRWGVPAFIIRLAFLGLTALFGIGIALYLIFWISLDTSSDRNSTLEAHGKARTARQIATFEAPKDSTLVQLQRILFLPISIIGTLASVIGNHFVNRKGGYLTIVKNLFAAFLLFIGVMICVGVAEFYVSHIFSRPVTTILSLSVLYLLILLLAIYIREYYLSNSLRKVEKKLKVAAIIPAVIIVMATSYMIKQQSEDIHEIAEKQFTVEKQRVTLDIDNLYPEGEFFGSIKFKVRTNESLSKLNLLIDYSSSGSDEKDALDNAHAVDFFFTFESGVLKMNRYWTLKDGAYNRGQSVYVTIEIPQNTKLVSSRKLDIMELDNGYEYWAAHSYHGRLEYYASGEYLHELDKEYANRLSYNELVVLTDKFCAEYFITESWSCDYNIRQQVERNSRFDRAFEKDLATIDQLREYMLSDRSLFVTNLNEMVQLVNSISIEYPVKNEFHQYLEHLQKVKSNPALVSLAKSG
jgi:phage shock protein PspC (stress-responsive transcriptional regulator)